MKDKFYLDFKEMIENENTTIDDIATFCWDYNISLMDEVKLFINFVLMIRIKKFNRIK